MLLKKLATHVLKVFTIHDLEGFFVFCGANEQDLAGYDILRQGNVQMINPRRGGDCVFQAQFRPAALNKKQATGGKYDRSKK